MGYYRDSFYEVRWAFQIDGVAGLVEEHRGPKGPHPNRVSEEVEEKSLAYALEHPTHGQQRFANELRNLHPCGLRGVGGVGEGAQNQHEQKADAAQEPERLR